MSEFSDRLPGTESKLAEARNNWLAAQALTNHLIKISGDYTGSSLEDYLSGKDIDNCRDFLEEAERRNFPNAIGIDLQQRKYSDRAVWSRPDKFTKIHHPDLFMQPVWQGQGYIIGELQLAVGSCRLALSPRKNPENHQIGELRCHRSPNIFTTSYGQGYGRLPDLPPAETPIKIPNLPKRLIDYLTK